VTRIPCLSLQQPYATALVAGTKDGENRPRRIFKVPPGGMWVAVHASAKDYGKGKAEQEHVREIVRRKWPGLPAGNLLARGAIIGAVRFDWDEAFPELYHGDNYHDPDEDPVVCARLELLRASVWAFGDHCYHVAERRTLARPIPASGALGLWNATAVNDWSSVRDADRIGALVELVPEWA
jgi:hypothetical protein